MRIGIGVSKKRSNKKNGIDIKIIRIVRSLFIAGNKISNYQLFETVPSVMVIVSMIGKIRDSKMVIDVSMSRSGEEL